jgi:hypothetical protein
MQKTLVLALALLLELRRSKRGSTHTDMTADPCSRSFGLD